MENGSERMRKSYPHTMKEAETVLFELPKFTSKNELGNTRRLLHLLGDPQNDFRVIHVAGTNGKGSTCAFLESIFRCMGMRTGLFTSPHLVRSNERFRVSGVEIPDDEFLEMFLRVQGAVEELIRTGGSHPTFFEYLFAMGLCWFADRQIDILICETGMGGRLDATNSIKKVEAVVITSISLDHTEYLGDTIAEIAYEKAGIIREETPVIYCNKDPESAGVISKRCREMNAPEIILTPDMTQIISGERDRAGFSLTPEPEGGFDCRLNYAAAKGWSDRWLDPMAVKGLSDRRTMPLSGDSGSVEFHIPFPALYQMENASLAALCALNCGADTESVKTGITRTRWPGRMEELRPDVYLDGAHNIDGIMKLGTEIRRIARTRKVSLLTAIVGDKAYREMVRQLCSAARYESVITTSVGGPRALDADLLAKEFMDAGQKNVEAESDAGKAYRMARLKQKDSVLVCAGSLYLMGEIHALEDQS